MNIKQKIAAAVIGLAGAFGCHFNGGSVEPIVGFGARAIENSGVSYSPGTSFGVRGSVRTTKSGLEIEGEAKLYSTRGEAGVVNHDVSATEVSVNVTHPIYRKDSMDIYVGAGVTNTSQTVDETYDVISSKDSWSETETDIRAIAGLRYFVGPGAVDGRVEIGSRGTTASLGYVFDF